MTNMMNGAVAIYGGVGVMEIRQPLPQAVESVAQAVEALAVNAHISLRELKNCVDKVLEKKIPGYKQLMEMNPVVAARATVNGATITAYTNGYAVYEADDTHTVLDVNRCGDYRYDFNDGTYVSSEAINHGVCWDGYKVVEGRSKRQFLDPKAVAGAATQAGYTDIYKTEMISLTEFEKLMGKKKFQEVLGEYVVKPPGKLALVPDSDPRPAVDLDTAADEFTPLE